MRSVRLSLAALAAGVLLVPAFVGVADAQEPNEITTDLECDTTTGEYVLTISVENFLNESAEIVGEYDYETESEGGSPVIDFFFVPDPLPALGTSTAEIVLPGDTVFVEGIVEVQYEQFLDTNDFSSEIGELCEAIPTTTTTTSTTTTAPPLVEVVEPTFTG